MRKLQRRRESQNLSQLPTISARSTKKLDRRQVEREREKKKLEKNYEEMRTRMKEFEKQHAKTGSRGGSEPPESLTRVRERSEES